MSVGLEGIMSQLITLTETVEKGQDNKIMSDFDKMFNISSEKHEKVASLLEQLIDSQEAQHEYEEEAVDNKDNIDNLNKDIAKLVDDFNRLQKSLESLTQGTDEYNNKIEEITAKLEEISKKEYELEELSHEKAIEREKKEQEKLKRKLGKENIHDTKAATDEYKKAKDKKKQGFAGKVSSAKTMMKNITNSPAFMIANFLVKAIEFGIGKATEYAKVGMENLTKAINATTTVSINKLKVGLESWKNAAEGAYAAQSLSIESQMAVVDASKEIELANMKLQHTWTNWIPIWGSINKYQEEMLQLEYMYTKAKLERAQKEIQMAQDYAKQTDEYFKIQDKAVHKLQTVNGLTKEQTQIFEQRMFKAGKSFANFNKTIEDAIKMQEAFASQSGRSINFTDSDFTKSFAVGRLVGEDNLTQFQSMMNIFNTSVSDSADIMYDMYNDANKMGISQQRLTKNVLSNLKMANKYDFKNGVRGFIEMSKWAESARISLNSIGSALEKVQSGGLEGMIKQSAGLQVLGGNIAMGADPFAMMFEAFSSPEDYGKRIQSMLKSYGSFNKETGETTFTMNEQMILRTMSEQLSIPLEEIKDMARGSRQKEYVMAQMGNSTLNKEQQEAIANKAEYNQQTKKWYVKTINGDTMDVDKVTQENLNQIMSNNKEENAEKYAQGTYSKVEEIEKTTRLIASLLGNDNYEDLIKHYDEVNQMTRDAYEQNHEEVAKSNKLIWDDARKKQEEMLGKLGTLSVSTEQGLETINAMSSKIDKMYEKMFAEMEKTIEEKDLRDKRKNSSADAAKYSEFRKNKIEEVTEEATKHSGYWRNIGDAWTIGRHKIKYANSKINEAKVNNESTADAQHYKTHAIRDAVALVGTSLFGMTASKTEKKYLKPFDEAYQNKAFNKSQNEIVVGGDKVTPVKNVKELHDGAVEYGRVDNNDTALFAKSGGPFDKLFNGVFGRIDDIYNNIFNSSSNTNIGNVSNMMSSNISKIFGDSTNIDWLPVVSTIDKSNKTKNSISNNVNKNSERVFKNTSYTADPINMLYESYSEPEAFVKRMKTMVNGYVTNNKNANPIQMLYETFTNNTSLKQLSNVVADKTKGMLSSGIDGIKSLSAPQQMIIQSLSKQMGVSPNDIKSSILPRMGKQTEIMEYKKETNTNGGVNNVPSNTNYSQQPIDVKLSGEITLKTENGQTFDITKQLENDPMLIRAISRMISKQITVASNGGRGKSIFNIGSV